ncbi:MAG: hypothetical protein Q8S27_19700, partial [Hoeflea sp.]|nr:hypothetical protein [Hoeflea sp.]
TQANYVKSVLIGLDPVALLSGQISVTSVDIAGVGLTAPESEGFTLTDLASFRVDATDAMIEEMFLVLNRIAGQVNAIEAGAFRFSDITISGRGEGIEVANAEVRRLDRLNYEINAEVVRAGQAISIEATAKGTVNDTGLSEITARIEGFALEIATGEVAERQNGVSMPLSIAFSASRARPGVEPALSANLSARDGTITMGGVAAELRDARVRLIYMPAQNKIEITPSVIRIGETVLPFTGGLIDADRIDEVEGAGIAFDFVIKEGRAAPGDSDEAPISFDGKALGRFDAAARLLVAEELALATPQGDLYGSASWHFVEGISPEINLVARVPRMSMAAVKQFWPYWVGKMARTWVLDNLYGGIVSN